MAKNKTHSVAKATWSHISTNVDEQWQHKFVNYMMDNNISACYWSLNPESDDTYGWVKTEFDPISAKDKWGTWGDGTGNSILMTANPVAVQVLGQGLIALDDNYFLKKSPLLETSAGVSRLFLSLRYIVLTQVSAALSLNNKTRLADSAYSL